ncbi:MAG: methyltransferase domain-containing protein [Firmicutes bacterium]|nr:methyltransferase domain-containing protein [Bacillota bacterium]
MARFDAVAARYDRFCETPLGRYVDEVERSLLEALMQVRPGERWIDLGTGTGSYALSLAHHGAEVVAVDESAAMLQIAQAKRGAQDPIALVQADLERLPFPDARFDGGVMQVVLEFVADPLAALREARRVIRPQGRLVIGLIHASGPWAAYYRKRAGREPDSVWRHARFWTLPELILAMGKAPTEVRAGLFVAPAGFSSPEQALREEALRARRGEWEEAGFLAVRFDL